MQETEKILKALANKRRMAIVKLLDKRKGATVGEISDGIKLSFKSTSKHMAILRAADIVDREQVNLNMIYKLAAPHHPIVKSTLTVL